MAVPKFFEFFEGFLFAIKDGELHTANGQQIKQLENRKFRNLWVHFKDSRHKKGYLSQLPNFPTGHCNMRITCLEERLSWLMG